jgi:hypothetical protein
MNWEKGKYGNEKIDNCSLDLSIDRSTASFRSTHTFLPEGDNSSGQPVIPADENEDHEKLCLCLCCGFNICKMLSHVFAHDQNLEKNHTIRRCGS